MGRDGKGTATIALATCLALAAVLWLPAAGFGGPLITDNFNKAPGADLGATEPPSSIPWTKGPGSGALMTISGDGRLALAETTDSPGGPYLTGSLIQDFDMTVKVQFTPPSAGFSGWYAYISYRATNPAVEYSGFDVEITNSGAMYLYTPATGHLAGVATGLDWVNQSHLVRIRVEGTHHQCWVDGNPMWDVTTNYKNEPGAFALCRRHAGTYYDDFSLEVLDQFGTVSGTVRDGVSHNPIAGAAIDVAGKTATSGADGKYTVSNVITGDRPMSVLKENYYPFNQTVAVVAGTTLTQDVDLVPLGTPAVTVYDTFSRADSADMGTTEDPGHYVWEKSSPTSDSGILNQMMNFNEGASDGATLLGFYPSDFELTANLTAGAFGALGTAGFAYRGALKGDDGIGYALRIDPDTGDTSLFGHGTELAKTNIPYPPVDFYLVPGPVVKIRAVGRWHQIWVDGVKYFDYVDNSPDARVDGGFVSVTRNSDFVKLDNLNIDAWRISAAGSVTGVVSSGGTPLQGAEVSITGIVKVLTGADGSFSLGGLPPGTATVTASAPGYEVASQQVTVPSGGTAVQDFQLQALPPGVISDTFSRDDNVDLGTTEDSSHTLWVKGPDPDTSINVSERSLLLGYPYGNGAGLAGVSIQDFELEFDTWVTQKGPYSMVEYRIPLAPGANEGTRNDTKGFQVQFQTNGVHYLWSGETGHLAGANTGVTNWAVPHHFRVRVVGTRHQAWQDGVLIWDVSSEKNVAPGAIAFLHYGQGTRYDNIRLSPITTTSVSTIDALMELPDGTPVVLQSAVVTGKIPLVGFWYVEEPDRSNGIKLVGPTTAVAGDVVKVVGEMATQNGERHIKVNAASDVTILSSGTPPRPLFVRGADLDAPGGLAVTGLLITVAGKVTAADVNFMEITDGSGTNQWIWHEDLGTSNPSVGDFVVLTGEAGKWDGNRSILWMRSPSDLMKVAP